MSDPGNAGVPPAASSVRPGNAGVPPAASSIRPGNAGVPPAASSIRLEVHSLCKAYPGLRVLADLDLQVAAGEIVAVRGASGTGKSTLLHCLGLLDRPDSGAILLDGEDLAQLAESRRGEVRARRIGFVFQAFHLLSDFTLRENVLMGARTAGLPLAEARVRAGELLERVGLGGRDGDVRILSGGEIVALARRDGASVILVTHDSEVAGRADRRLELHDGRLHACG